MEWSNEDISITEIYTKIKDEFRKTNISDAVKYIKLARLAEKHAIYNKTTEKSVKIAFVGTNSIQFICKVLKLFLFIKHGIYADIYEGDYAGITNAVLDETSGLYGFSPDVVIMIPDISDIKEFPPLFADSAETETALEVNVGFYTGLWEKLLRTGAHILQANFIAPPINQLGNLEGNYSFSKVSFIQALNLKLIQKKKNNVTFLDFNALASNLGKLKWFDYKSYFLYKQGFNLDFLGNVCELICIQVIALLGITKKCLVLDLDNTLWGGAVGDCGFEGIQLDPQDPLGEAYRFFQNYILELKNRGVIIAVCSKNDIETAKEPFVKNKNMLLKLDDISCFIANWNDKATNILRIAEELNIATDSMVFFDDNPAEREIVKNNLPEVMVIDVPYDPADYASVLNSAYAFDWIQITEEDLGRTSSYIIDEIRRKLERKFIDYNEYLQTLAMSADIGFLDKKRIPRFTQLINKTNQFNLRTKRYSESKIAELMNRSEYRLIYVELSDKFSDYGLISCVILKAEEMECFIDTWLMSCRVFKRGVEDLVFNFIVKTVKSLNCSKIIGEYIPTLKNAMVKDFYLELGFKRVEINSYVFRNLETNEKKTYIELEGEDEK